MIITGVDVSEETGVLGFGGSSLGCLAFRARIIASISASRLVVHLSCCDHNECRSRYPYHWPCHCYHTLHLRRQLAHHPCRWTLGSDNIASSAELSGMTATIDMAQLAGSGE